MEEIITQKLTRCPKEYEEEVLLKYKQDVLRSMRIYNLPRMKANVLRSMRGEILLKNLMNVPRSMKGGTKWT